MALQSEPFRLLWFKLDLVYIEFLTKLSKLKVSFHMDIQGCTACLILKKQNTQLYHVQAKQVLKSVEEFVLSTYLAESNGWMAFLIQPVS